MLKRMISPAPACPRHTHLGNGLEVVVEEVPHDGQVAELREQHHVAGQAAAGAGGGGGFRRMGGQKRVLERGRERMMERERRTKKGETHTHTPSPAGKLLEGAEPENELEDPREAWGSRCDVIVVW